MRTKQLAGTASLGTNVPLKAAAARTRSWTAGRRMKKQFHNELNSASAGEPPNEVEELAILEATVEQVRCGLNEILWVARRAELGFKLDEVRRRLEATLLLDRSDRTEAGMHTGPDPLP